MPAKPIHETWALRRQRSRIPVWLPSHSAVSDLGPRGETRMLPPAPRLPSICRIDASDRDRAAGLRHEAITVACTPVEAIGITQPDSRRLRPERPPGRHCPHHGAPGAWGGGHDAARRRGPCTVTCTITRHGRPAPEPRHAQADPWPGARVLEAPARSGPGPSQSDVPLARLFAGWNTLPRTGKRLRQINDTTPVAIEALAYVR